MTRKRVPDPDADDGAWLLVPVLLWALVVAVFVLPRVTADWNFPNKSAAIIFAAGVIFIWLARMMWKFAKDQFRKGP